MMLLKKFSQEFQKISRLQISANNLLNWLMQKKSSALNSEPDFVMDGFRAELFNAYNLYLKGERHKTIVLKKFFVPRNIKFRSIQNLARKFTKNSKYFMDVIVHGSVATSEVVDNWSDVDILAIIKKDIFENQAKFLSLRKFLISAEYEIYKFDPYQHHGIQFISEDDLRFYPEYFLPIEVLKHGKTLIKNSKIDFFIRNSTIEKEQRFYSIARLLYEAVETGALKHHAQNGVYLKDNFENKKDNFYQLKYFMSLVLLLPSLFLELVDKSVYKKHSFDKIKNYFNKEDLEIVNKCEEARRLFSNLKIKKNEIPKGVINILGNNYFKRATRLVDKMVKRHKNIKHP